ncbi:MAG: hypothetical protein H7330_10990 [Hymenobacteraceae bacterium]|nr:hypothetical protein [Hymenobacteraceae bacterium]
MSASDPTNPTTPDPANAANTSQEDSTPPQTRGQNPDRAHEGALQTEGTTTTPDDATQRGGYAGSAQGEYDNRDGAPREGGGRSNPAPTNASTQPGNTSGYTNEAARQGSVAQGTGSRGGSYNDQNANAPHAPAAGRTASDEASTTGAASGLLNTGPRQQQAEQQAQTRSAGDLDSGGASAGRAPRPDSDADERA